MVLILVLSWAAGFLFNEEQIWQRICRNMSYPHLGWLLLSNGQALCFFIAGCIGSVLKVWALSKVLTLVAPNYYGVALLCYLGGNILAVRTCKGLYYTPWLSLWGVGLTIEPILFQIPCTALCVVWLLFRDFSLAVKAAIITGVIAACYYFSGYQLLLLLGSVLITRFFSGRQAPFWSLVIRYRGKLS